MSCMKKPELIGPLLGYCNHRAYQRMEQKLRRYGVTPIQCRSLTYLHRQPGPVTQKQLQQHLAVKPSTVNGIVDRLVEKGMLHQVQVIDLSDASHITMRYMSRFDVQFLWDADFDYKLDYLAAVVDRLEDNEKGSIDMTQEGKASFIPG